jgi:hypothetical protein
MPIASASDNSRYVETPMPGINGGISGSTLAGFAARGSERGDFRLEARMSFALEDRSCRCAATTLPLRGNQLIN